MQTEISTEKFIVQICNDNKIENYHKILDYFKQNYEKDKINRLNEIINLIIQIYFSELKDFNLIRKDIQEKIFNTINEFKDLPEELMIFFSIGLSLFYNPSLYDEKLLNEVLEEDFNEILIAFFSWDDTIFKFTINFLKNLENLFQKSINNQKKVRFFMDLIIHKVKELFIIDNRLLKNNTIIKTSEIIRIFNKNFLTEDFDIIATEMINQITHENIADVKIISYYQILITLKFKFLITPENEDKLLKFTIEHFFDRLFHLPISKKFLILYLEYSKVEDRKIIYKELAEKLRFHENIEKAINEFFNSLLILKNDIDLPVETHELIDELILEIFIENKLLEIKFDYLLLFENYIQNFSFKFLESNIDKLKPVIKILKFKLFDVNLSKRKKILTFFKVLLEKVNLENFDYLIPLFDSQNEWSYDIIKIANFKCNSEFIKKIITSNLITKENMGDSILSSNIIELIPTLLKNCINLDDLNEILATYLIFQFEKHKNIFIISKSISALKKKGALKLLKDYKKQFIDFFFLIAKENDPHYIKMAEDGISDLFEILTNEEVNEYSNQLIKGLNDFYEKQKIETESHESKIDHLLVYLPAITKNGDPENLFIILKFFLDYLEKFQTIKKKYYKIVYDLFESLYNKGFFIVNNHNKSQIIYQISNLTFHKKLNCKSYFKICSLLLLVIPANDSIKENLLNIIILNNYKQNYQNLIVEQLKLIAEKRPDLWINENLTIERYFQTIFDHIQKNNLNLESLLNLLKIMIQVFEKNLPEDIKKRFLRLIYNLKPIIPKNLMKAYYLLLFSIIKSFEDINEDFQIFINYSFEELKSTKLPWRNLMKNIFFELFNRYGKEKIQNLISENHLKLYKNISKYIEWTERKTPKETIATKNNKIVTDNKKKILPTNKNQSIKSKKHRIIDDMKLPDEYTGKIYKSRNNLKGDIHVMNKPLPFAYVPLNRKLLSSKKRKI